ncbi:hypothetical protein E2C01_018814 [Portunus trituberculatus]|uniref:Uncharacterized protein n=1 Tax=Portunus trituberculatus TaxID=210409 RepID=A0A5B7DVN8_PORTR|nr:hypothetical protein [Portunus trituberculatus]
MVLKQLTPVISYVIHGHAPQRRNLVVSFTALEEGKRRSFPKDISSSGPTVRSSSFLISGKASTRHCQPSVPRHEAEGTSTEQQ